MEHDGSIDAKTRTSGASNMKGRSGVTVENPSTYSEASRSNMVDKMTLDCLMNRKRYKKYAAFSHSNNMEGLSPGAMATAESILQGRAKENIIFLEKMNKYKYKIMKLTEELLDNPGLMVTLDVNDTFAEYAKVSIRYLENKEYEVTDDDTLFGNIERSIQNDSGGSLNIFLRDASEYDEDAELRVTEKPVYYKNKDKTDEKLNLVSLSDAARMKSIAPTEEGTKSFWGKDRVVKKSYDNFLMNKGFFSK